MYISTGEDCHGACPLDTHFVVFPCRLFSSYIAWLRDTVQGCWRNGTPLACLVYADQVSREAARLSH